MAQRRVIRARAARAVAAVCVLALVGLVVMALRQPGFPQVPPTPQDRSIWLQSDDRGLVGRADLVSARLDSALAVKGSVRLIQDQTTGAVAIQDQTARELQLVDPALVTIGTRITLPDSPVVAMNAGRIAVADQATGKVWVASAQQPEKADTGSAKELASTEPGTLLAIAPSGTVYAVAAGSDRLLTIGADGIPLTRPLPGGRLGKDAAALSVATVGDRLVVWDRSTGILHTSDSAFAVNAVVGGQLQIPGPDRPDATLATARGLFTVDLTDGRVDRVAQAQGTPGRPAVIENGCRIGIFDDTGVISCPGRQQVAKELGGADLQLVRRGSDVVAGSARDGQAWVVGAGFRPVTGWDQVATENPGDRITDTLTDPDADATPPPPPNCAGVPVGRPRAADDTFAVRAGRVTVLPVLQNDPPTDCTAVVITAVTGLPAELGTASIVKGGTAIQLNLTAAATGALPVLEYRVDNGKAAPNTAPDTATATAKVTVTVAAPAEHRPPQRIRRSATEVEAGGTVSYDVLEDYRSPTGDDLFLTAASTESGDEVSFRPDGTITVHSTGTGVGGNHSVDFVVSDGHDQVRGTLTVGIARPGGTTPVSFPVYVTGTVGNTVIADPTRAIASGAVRPVIIGNLIPDPGNPTAAGTATAIVDPMTGRILVQAGKAGSYYFTFQAATGDKATTGVLRADFVDAGEARPAVPMVDVAYLTPGGSQLLDPLANDTDPAGLGLAVQKVTVPQAVQGLSASVVNLHQIRLEASRSIERAGPVVVDYTVYDGANLVHGQIRVITVPATTIVPPPVVSPISVSVRAGDAVTIPLEGHAVSQDGSALSVRLDPADIKAVPGVLFTDGTTIRYLAPAAAPAQPIVFAYTVVSARSTPAAPVRAASTVTVTVVPPDPDNNRAPAVPAPVVARAFVGGTIDVDLPINGIDPDGDWVIAAGLLPPAAPLGKAALHGATALRYTALNAPGIDRLEYTITDPFGQTAVGAVTVIVVPALGIAAPPLAPDLTAAVKPARTIRISPLASASDPSGTAISLTDFQTPAGFTATKDRDSLLVTAPATQTVATMRYTIGNTRGLTATGAITITVSAQAATPPPTAEDILVPPTDLGDGARSVAVDVAGHVSNRIGPAEALTLLVDKEFTTATVTGPTTVTVVLTDHRQVIAYRVRDPAGGTATAFLVVPPATQLVGPQLILGKDVIQVGAGKSVDITLADYVTVATGTPRLAEGAPLRTSQGTATRLDAGRVRLTMPLTAGGPAALYLPIDTPGAAPTVLALAVQVIPRVVPAPTIDAVVLPVEVGGSATLDLAPLTTTFDSVQRSALRWVVRSAPDGVDVSVNGSVLTAALSVSTRRGTTFDVPVQVTAGDGQSARTTITVRATGSRKPLPVVVSQQLGDVRPGQAVRFDLLKGSSDPVGGGLRVTKVVPTRGAAGLAAGPDLTGSTVSLRIAAGFAGQIVLTFTAEDATKDPEREVSGTLTLTISDRPTAPGIPTVVEGSRTATSVALSWSPADARGAAITGYTVTGGPEPVTCGPDSGSCRIDGLTPGRSYVFTVVAHNAIGDSAPSRQSAPVTPDATPGTPTAPRAKYVARGQISVTFEVPAGQFSPIRTVELQELVDGEPGRTLTDPQSPFTATGLDPSRQYTYRLRASNAEGAGPWSTPSAAVLPSGVPGAPQVQATLVFDGSTGRLKVSWTPPADDGGQAITGYRVLVDGQQVGTAGAAARSVELPAGGVGDKKITVLAENARGAGPAGSASIAVFGRPTAPGQPRVDSADRALKIGWTPGTTPGNTVGHYDYRIDGGAWTSVGAATEVTTPAALTNGRQYTVQVRLCNAAPDYPETATCSPPSTPTTGTPYGPPSKPEVTIAVGDGVDELTFHEVTVSWTWPAGDGRPVASREVTIVADGDKFAPPPGDSSGRWTKDVGWGKTVTATVKYCLAGSVGSACGEATVTATTARSYDMRAVVGSCKTPTRKGGAWPDQAACEGSGGVWVPASPARLEVLSCARGEEYPTNPADQPTSTVTTTVPTTVTTVATTTSVDPGPPPSTSTMTTTSRIPTSTVVTTTSTLPADQLSDSYYLGTNGGYYRKVALAQLGFGGAPQCR